MTANSKHSPYSSFDQIDGSHSFKEVVPNGYVDYPVRTRHGGNVFYFNFELAKEMGLIPQDHAHEMTAALKQKILHAFSIVIINEYDEINNTPIDPKDVRPNHYMATRYLQLQHPNKQGKTSGDGRGIWNGEVTHQGTTWDVSSSGTGATCLSPAHAQTNRYFKTGDKVVGYGNGYNYLSDGMSAALMSEIFHKNGVSTERTLAIINFEGGSSINVRAGKNLFRPAHFFHQMKQGNYEGLKASIDYYIDRQVKNREWSKVSALSDPKVRYTEMAENMARVFSKVSAQFEAEYIFCWLDWDGDNILADGGIIDYGSIRQFGLYHWEYRYDDVDRMSTNIPEQKQKARYIVQTFAQIRDFLITGKKKQISEFRNDRVLKQFDRNFKATLNEKMMRKLGFSKRHTSFLTEKAPRLVRELKELHSYFEKAKSNKGVYKISDGVTCDAVFCMRDLHRELPKRLYEAAAPLKATEFVEILKSSYAKEYDLRLSSYRRQKIQRFQELYLKMLKRVAGRFYADDLKRVLREVIMRASVTNQQFRITGDGVLTVTSILIRNRKKLTFEEKLQVIDTVVDHQVAQKSTTSPDVENPAVEGEAKKAIEKSLKAIEECAEGF